MISPYIQDMDAGCKNMLLAITGVEDTLPKDVTAVRMGGCMCIIIEETYTTCIRKLFFSFNTLPNHNI